MKQAFRLTQKGVDELKAELEQLVASRIGIASDISFAREQGDLSENAEYQAAKQNQDRVENRIKEIENILKNTMIIKQPKATGSVQLGLTVKLKSTTDNDQVVFSIVGTVEADPFKGRLSDESPIGRALIGKSVGDVVEIVKQGKALKYTIKEIS